MTFLVARWDSLDDSLAFYLCKGKNISEHANGKCYNLHFNMQEEDIFEHHNGKCHLCIL